MAVKLYKHILKDKPLPLCLCLTVPGCRLTFPHSSAQAVKLRSSYTIHALTLIHHLWTVTSYITLHWMHSSVALPTYGLLHNRTPAFSSWLCEGFSAGALVKASLNSTLSPLIPAPGCPLGPRGPSKPRSPCQDGQKSYCKLTLEISVRCMKIMPK